MEDLLLRSNVGTIEHSEHISFRTAFLIIKSDKRFDMYRCTCRYTCMGLVHVHQTGQSLSSYRVPIDGNTAHYCGFQNQ